MAPLDMVLTVVFICVGIALAALLIELIRLLKSARATLDSVKSSLDPMMVNIKEMTDDIKPVMAKVDPMVDRVQLTIDAVNLEMMRMDEILEDVSQITDAASSATTAVESATNAPIKAVSNVASKMRSKFGNKAASHESAQLAEQHDAVERALEDYRAAQSKEDGDSSLEPNFEGFETLVSESNPKVMQNTGEIQITEDVLEEAAQADAAQEETKYYSYDEAEAK